MWPIWRAVVSAGDTYVYDPRTTSDQARGQWLDGGGEVWRADADRRAVGLYRLGANQAGPGGHVANASYMVAAGGRGRGYGRVMVEHSIERARALGFRGLQFNAVAATNVHAIRLYHDLGFATVGAIPGGFRHPTTGYVELFVMYRQL